MGTCKNSLRGRQRELVDQPDSGRLPYGPHPTSSNAARLWATAFENELL